MRLPAFVTALRARLPGGAYAYRAISFPSESRRRERRETTWPLQTRRLLKAAMLVTFLAVILYLLITFGKVTSCESLGTCHPISSHLWGQYSPVFSVPSRIKTGIPHRCEVTFVQVLSRHGARDPTATKSAAYNNTVSYIHDSVTTYGRGYEFIKDYRYTLGADRLTYFGEKQMVDSGAELYTRYKHLGSNAVPFIRASAQNRVIMSALNWTQGFYSAKVADGQPPGDDYRHSIILIPEHGGSNNTLNHGLCTAFEQGSSSHMGEDAQAVWREIFAKPIADRLNGNLVGANLSTREAIHVMDLCPFNTVADNEGRISDFCNLFTLDEWKSYDYYQSLGKYYGFNAGNPLGPTQGVGFVNELIARLTGQPVLDHTSTNSTLDSSPATFPLDRTIFADFSHDNDMTTVYGALGLYDGTTPLPKTSKHSPAETGGYSASWTVPFAGRMYVEKMRCNPREPEMVRVLVNDRVVPLRNCDADALGRCTLDAFVKSLGFARGGGLWDECFA